MADISRLSRLLAGVQRQVDLSTNTLVVDNLKIKMGSGNDSFHATFSGSLSAARTISMPDANVNLADIATNKSNIDGHLDGGASKHDATEVDYERVDGSKKNIAAASDDVESALTNLDDAIGALDATPTNYTAADPAIVADHLAGIDAALASSAYTNEMAQDAVGGILTDSASVDFTYNDGANTITATVIQSGVDHGSISGLGDDDHSQYHNDARGDARYYQKSEFVTTSTAGAPVKLDGAGKIAIAQLPSAIMTYEGVFDASGTPASPLLNGDGAANTGMVYRASVAGSYDFGAGAIAFGIGDYAIYNSSGVWEKSDSTDAVASVNGATGIVTVNAINQLTGDVTAGPATGSQSAAATIAANAVTDTKLASHASSDASRAVGSDHIKTSAVTSAKIAADAVDGSKIADDSVAKEHIAADVAGAGLGQNVDGSLEVNVDDTTVELNSDALRVKDLGISTAKLAATSVTAAKLGSDVAGAGLSGGNGSALAVSYSPSVQAAGEVAGEAYSATTLYAVRYGQNAETAGRLYKADNDATSTDNFHVVGLALTVGALSAAGTMPSVVKMGLITVTGHGFTVGKPVWLGASGALTSTAPSAANSASVKVGMVKDANTIDVQIQVMGVN